MTQRGITITYTDEPQQESTRIACAPRGDYDELGYLHKDR